LAGVLSYALHSPPGFYTSAVIEAGEQRREDSALCERNFLALLNMFVSGDSNWSSSFTGRQINSYLQEDFEKVGGDQNLPALFSAPRVEFQNGTMRLGCVYGCGFWSTVLSLEVRVWLVADEINTIGLELVSLQAGSLGISPRWLLEPIAEAARRWNADLTWYQNQGNPAAVIRLQANQLRPTFQLQRLEILQDKLVLVGASTQTLGQP
jgi:hypothetical protein